MKPSKTATLDLVRLICRVLDDKKAEALIVLNVAEQSSITDYLILATATSEPHLRALRVELEKVLDTNDVRLVGMEATQESGWLVIDAFDVMVHLFLAEARERYGLERLWRDAEEMSVTNILAAPKKKPGARAPKSKRSAPPKRGRSSK